MASRAEAEGLLRHARSELAHAENGAERALARRGAVVPITWGQAHLDFVALRHEVCEGEPLLGADVLGDDGLGNLDRVGLRRVLAHGDAGLAHDAGSPAATGLDQQLVTLVVDLQSLGEARAERLADDAAGLVQHLVEIVAAQGELAEGGQRLLAGLPSGCDQP